MKMYRSLVERIRLAAPHVPVYLCMESPAVWKKVMGVIPSDRELGMQMAAGAAR